MSTERDELAQDIRGLGITVIDGPPVDLSEPLAQHLHNLGYRKPLYLSPGLYRNSLGVEIEVQSVEIARHIMGSVWNAYVKDDLFPRHVIVTPEGMRDAGYSRVEEA